MERMIPDDEVALTGRGPAAELVTLTPAQLDQRVDTLADEVFHARQWLDDRARELARAQRVRNHLARRRAGAPSFADL